MIGAILDQDNAGERHRRARPPAPRAAQAQRRGQTRVKPPSTLADFRPCREGQPRRTCRTGVLPPEKPAIATTSHHGIVDRKRAAESRAPVARTRDFRIIAAWSRPFCLSATFFKAATSRTAKPLRVPPQPWAAPRSRTARHQASI